MKNLAALQAECRELGIEVTVNGRKNKAAWIDALRCHYWEHDHPGVPLPEQIEPMLLSNWNNLTDEKSAELESDHHAWIVQPKLDGVRALLHVDNGKCRLTGRCISEITYRHTEHQTNLAHLTTGPASIPGTVLDGELICPVQHVNTGNTITSSPLQAAVAILATSPENAARIQRENDAMLQFHAFDVLQASDHDVTNHPLHERLGILERIFNQIENPHIEIVPNSSVNKAIIHDQVVADGGEGTVWKKASEPYEPGRRVKHWIKRKREFQVEAFVTDFKLGTPGRGHSNLIGAVEFSIPNGDGKPKPVAWVSNWSDEERYRMTLKDRDGNPTLNPICYGRKAIIVGQDEASRSGRIRHARLKQWSE